MASPAQNKRGRESRYDFLFSVPGVERDKLDAARRACERLTDEQLEVLKQARSPQEIVDRGSRITLILAAAASGKTTTMLALIETLSAFGHGRPNQNQFALYAMFNKTAAEDGNKKLAGGLNDDGTARMSGVSKFTQKAVDCSTSHSAALRHTPELKNNVRFTKRPGGPRHAEWTCPEMSQEAIEKYVMQHCGSHIDDFVLNGKPPPTDSKGQRALKKDTELCAFWIYKTWLNWVHKAGGEAKLGPNEIDLSSRIGTLTYYPCVKNYQEATSGGGGGVDDDGQKKKKRARLVGTFPGTFYTSEALSLWRRMMEERIFVTHDAYLKYAEIQKVRFSRFDSLLLDESQDLTECQVELFVVNQPQADIYIVGDAVQSLYSWRGARPKQLRKLQQRVGASRPVNEALQLTRSHRFGAGIARVANHMTFIKKHSKQHTLWHHYQIVGAGPTTLRLLGHSGSDSLVGVKRTVVGRSNAGLACEAFELLAGNPTTKIALLSSSHYDKFEKICNEVLELLPHATPEGRDQPFRFKGAYYESWEDFKEEVEYREMPYGTHLCLIGKFAEEGTLPELIATFREGVLERRLDESDCEVLLATACGAKGLEWDNVKVLDDYIRLVAFERVPDDELQPGSEYAAIHNGVDGWAAASAAAASSAAPAPGSETPAPGGVPMRFALKNDWKGDELNSWYVAITRARLRLELPEKFWRLYRAIWDGAGYTEDADDDQEPKYTAAEIVGINALLSKIRQTLPPAGSELDVPAGMTAASPPTPATAGALQLANLHMAEPQALHFDDA